MLVFSIIGKSSVAAKFSGIFEADETYQRESKKGSRERVRHFADPNNTPKPFYGPATTRVIVIDLRYGRIGSPGASAARYPLYRTSSRLVTGASILTSKWNVPSAADSRAMDTGSVQRGRGIGPMRPDVTG